MNEMVIVTAFFDIKRDEMNSFRRTNEQYLEYFDNWARIKNRLIVFCEEKDMKSILNIRKKYGLENKTDIYIVDNLLSLDEPLYNSIAKTMESSYFKEFMFYNENPEVTSPKYNYLMCIKPLFVNLAIQKYNLLGTIVWLDFGYNHGLEYYPNVNEFNFLWNYNFNPDYIHLFNIKKIPDTPIFEIIRRMDSYIQGGTLIADSSKWEEFWRITRENMMILNNVGLADDDQILYLMGYKRYPELFQLNDAHWNEAMKLYGGDHLTYVKFENSKKSSMQKVKDIYSQKVKFMRKIRYLIRTYKTLTDGKFNG